MTTRRGPGPWPKQVRCALCGGLSDLWANVATYEACYDCIASLVENEFERRGVREEERAMEDGWSGDDRLRQEMAEARKLK